MEEERKANAFSLSALSSGHFAPWARRPADPAGSSASCAIVALYILAGLEPVIVVMLSHRRTRVYRKSEMRWRVRHRH